MCTRATSSVKAAADLESTWYRARNSPANWPIFNKIWDEAVLGEKSDVYNTVHRFWEATGDLRFSQALFAMILHGFAGRDYRENLRAIQNCTTIVDDAKLSIAGMDLCARILKVSERRASKIVAAHLAIYLDANSFNAAVEHVRRNWREHKQSGSEVDLSVVKFVTRVSELNGALLEDPFSGMKLEESGMLVRNSGFWENAERSGLVVLNQAPLRP